MEMQHYIDSAKSVGYEIHFTGLGMAYITIGNVKLTEIKDIPEIEKELALIGIAMINDLTRLSHSFMIKGEKQ